MLLTKLIPPRSESLKDAVACFNRFIEEPHADKEEKCEISIYGGKGCCKSTVASGMVLKGIVETGTNAMCIRKQGCDLRDSCFAQLKWSAERLDVRFKTSLSPLRIEVGGKSRIGFFGTDFGFSKINSFCIANRPKVVWIEEADQLCDDEFTAIVDGGLLLKSNPIIISTFNPQRREGHWINSFVNKHKKSHGYGGMWFFNPCYTEIEREWLGENFFAMAEKLRTTDSIAYCHEYLGIPQEG